MVYGVIQIVKILNSNRAIKTLGGICMIAVAVGFQSAVGQADLTGAVAIVIGSEGDGMSRLALEKCDRTVSLPIRGHIDSLNASVAAGILMYEIVRQRAR